MEFDVASQLSDLDGVLPPLAEFGLPGMPTVLSSLETTTVLALSDELDGLAGPRLKFGNGSSPGASFDSGICGRAAEQTSVLDGRGAAASARVSKKRTTGNVSHTRRCRAKVNSKLAELLAVLPEAASAAGGVSTGCMVVQTTDGGGRAKDKAGMEVKHKAQIIGLAIERFEMLRARNIELEMRLAMSSPHQMRRWVRGVADSAPNLKRALEPFMAMICLTRSWKYAELWEPVSAGTLDDTMLRYRTSVVPARMCPEERARLLAYRQVSKQFRFVPRAGVPGRVYLTMRPEWLPALDDAIAFPRAPHAVRHKVEVTFAVPVIIDGQVRMVVEFYDTAKRSYDPAVLNVANEIAAMFAAAFEERVPRSCPVVSEIV